MFVLYRYRGPAVVLIALLVCLVVVDLSLTAAVGLTGRWLPGGEMPADLQVYRTTGGKLTGVTAGATPVGIGTGTPFGVMLGMSGLGASVDSRVVEDHDGLPVRWLNLHGWGGNLHVVRSIADLIPMSGLRPDAVVIALQTNMLVGQDFETAHGVIASNQGKRLKPWIWVYNNRVVVNHLTRAFELATKLELCRSLGFGLRAVFPPVPERPATPRNLPDSTAAQLEQKMDYGRKIGWFDPKRYSPDSPNARALVAVIRQARARGAKVGLILLPERSQYRAEIPPEAVRCLAEINRRDFPDDPVPVYDLRDRLPDDQFRDLLHVKTAAKERVSVLVGRCVRDLLSGHPSPDRLRAAEAGPAGGGDPPATP